MKRLSIIALVIALLLPLAIWAQCGICNKEGKDAGCGMTMQNASVTTNPATRLDGFNKPIKLDANHYFTYNFSKKPKLGTAILEVKVFNKDKKISKDFEVFAASDMPSMKGAHATGDVKLKANKKGILLVPINFVMPGVWQVDLKFMKDGKKVFDGFFNQKI